MKMAALVLASGLSRRYGKDDKLMATLKGQALLAYCLDAAKGALFDGYFVVTPDPDPRADLARSFGFTIIPNSIAEAGQGVSISAGVSEIIDKGFESICLLLGDMPFVTSDYLRKLKSHAPDSDIIFSQVNTQNQPPAIFRGQALRTLKNLSGDRGANSLDLANFAISHMEMSEAMAKDFDLATDFMR